MATDKDTKEHHQSSGRLVDAVRRLKIDAADAGDVVVDMKEADRARLELLAEALKPSFDEVPLDDDRFDFALSSGLQPRLWIDATAHVMMGRDRRTYRFVRDTRLGRVVLAEAVNMAPIETAVVDYIAERLLERERVLAGDTMSYRSRASGTPSTRQDEAKGPEEAAFHLSQPEPGRLPVHAKGPDLSAAENAEMPAKHRPSSAEPSTAKAFVTMFWIALGLVVGGGALGWFIGLIG